MSAVNRNFIYAHIDSTLKNERLCAAWTVRSRVRTQRPGLASAVGLHLVCHLSHKTSTFCPFLQYFQMNKASWDCNQA